MAEETTYYAIFDDYASGAEPVGVLRRFTGGGRRDESFGGDLERKFSSLLHSAERGDTEYDLVPISEDEASQIVTRIRAATTPGE
jgi:hypothetical protein